MCLHIRHYQGGSKNEYVRTASRNITVYKKIERTPFGSYFHSPFRYTTYQRGETKTAPKFSGRRGIVEQGLHAYTSLEKAKSRSYFGYNSIIVKCVIPKGTKYILGLGGEVVSLSLRVGEAVAGYGYSTYQYEFNTKVFKKAA